MDAEHAVLDDFSITAAGKVLINMTGYRTTGTTLRALAGVQSGEDSEDAVCKKRRYEDD